MTVEADVVLTVEGRVLLEAKAEKLRTTILPTMLRAFCADPRDEVIRASYEDFVTELRWIESMLAPSGDIRH